MRKKRFLALLTAATMVLSPISVFATSTDVTTEGGSSTAGGDSTVPNVDMSDKILVTLPTAKVLNFTVDPQGLLSLGDSPTNADDLTGAGAIVPNQDSGAFIKNLSNVPVDVAVDLSIKETTAGTVKLKTTYDDVEPVDTPSTDLNMLLLAIPGNAKIPAIADAANGYKPGSIGVPVTKVEADTAATDLTFNLAKADYLVTKSGTAPAFTYSYAIDPATDNYDSASFKLGGIVNTKADWSNFAKAVTPETVEIEAVFTCTKAQESSKPDETLVAKGAYGLMSALSTVEVEGAVGGMQTQTIDRAAIGNAVFNMALPAGAASVKTVTLVGAKTDNTAPKTPALSAGVWSYAGGKLTFIASSAPLKTNWPVDTYAVTVTFDNDKTEKVQLIIK